MSAAAKAIRQPAASASMFGRGPMAGMGMPKQVQAQGGVAGMVRGHARRVACPAPSRRLLRGARR